MTYQSYAKEKKGERKRDLGINRKTNVLFRSPDDVFSNGIPSTSVATYQKAMCFL